MHPPPDSAEGQAARLLVLEKLVESNERRIRATEAAQVRAEERHTNVQEDMAEVKSGVKSCAENCQAIRDWVRGEMEKAEEKAKQENVETRRLKTSEKVALLTVGGGLLGAIIAAVAAIIAANAGGG
jgi:hypothetical protein